MNTTYYRIGRGTKKHDLNARFIGCLQKAAPEKRVILTEEQADKLSPCKYCCKKEEATTEVATPKAEEAPTEETPAQETKAETNDSTRMQISDRPGWRQSKTLTTVYAVKQAIREDIAIQLGAPVQARDERNVNRLAEAIEDETGESAAEILRVIREEETQRRLLAA